MLGELETGNVKRDGEKLGLFDLKKNIKRDLILPNSSLPFQSDLGTRRIDIQTWSQSGVSSIPVSFANIEKGKAEVILWRTITLKILWTLIQLVKPLCHGSSTVLQQGFGVQSYGVGGQKDMSRRCWGTSWPRCDLNTQPSDLESDALPLRHEVRGGPLSAQISSWNLGHFWGNGNFVLPGRGVAPLLPALPC